MERGRVRRRWLKALLLKALDLLHLKKVELSLYITTDQVIRELNREYRGKDKPTDVLSFPMGEKVGSFTLLGDIVISWDTAKRQAKEYGHSTEEEIKRLALHGLVHLLGYDHELGGEEERKFFSLENYLLSELSHIAPWSSAANFLKRKNS